MILPIILSLAIDNISDKYKGFNFRFGEEYARIDNISTQYSAKNRTKCFNKENDIADKRCEIGKISSTKKVLLIGDSNANHFWNFFDVIGKKYGIWYIRHFYYEFQLSGFAKNKTIPLG